MPRWLAATRPVSGGLISLALVVFMALGVASNLWVSVGDVLRPLCRATGYLVAPTLLNYVPFFLTLGILFRVAGKLRWRELGFEAPKLRSGLLWCGMAWVLAQVMLFVLAGGDLEFDPRWRTQPTVRLGALLGQLLGNALCEEVFWVPDVAFAKPKSVRSLFFFNLCFLCNDLIIGSKIHSTISEIIFKKSLIYGSKN